MISVKTSLHSMEKVLLSAVLLFLTGSVLAKDSIEIASAVDFEAPRIEHNLKIDVARDKAGNVIVNAKVTDESSVNSVFIYYRNANDNKYNKRPMSLSERKGKDIYSLAISRDVLGGDQIEYYFEADDKMGNKKLKGLEFSPLKRVISDLVMIDGSGSSAPSEGKAGSSLDTPMVWLPGL